MNNDFEAKLRELRRGYLNKLRIILHEVRALCLEIPINIQDVYSKIHTISGTSGMYSLNDLSNVSTVFEFYLKPLKENPETIQEEELKTKLSEYIVYLEKLLTGD